MVDGNVDERALKANRQREYAQQLENDARINLQQRRYGDREMNGRSRSPVRHGETIRLEYTHDIKRQLSHHILDSLLVDA